ncbi:cadherin-related family member 1-like [Ptychodera flava]|uniref:cadherin-related family member 1-like n=1 Tax=Ptychodera flava TaxID=63121 RepID=UPI00396A35C8
MVYVIRREAMTGCMDMRSGWLLLFLLALLPERVTANLPPEFVEIPGTSPRKYYDMNGERYREDTPVGTMLYTLIAEDVDGDYITITVDTGRDFFRTRGVNGTHTDVELIKALDYETDTRHDVRWILDDGHSNSVPHDITIYVTDVNDNAPVFQDLPYSVDVSEATPMDTTIFTFSATDEDSGANGRIDFTIDGEDIDLFRLENDPAINGKASIVLNKSLDYEVKILHRILIRATDRGTDPRQLSANSTLTVSVLDVQDTPPFWIGEPYQVFIFDSTPVGKVVTIVTARDGDRFNPNEVMYATLNDSLADYYFNVTSITGEVIVSRELDDQIIGLNNLTVVAIEEDPYQELEAKSSYSIISIEVLKSAEEATPGPDYSDAVAATVALLLSAIVAIVLLGICIYHKHGDQLPEFRKKKKVSPTKKY